MYIENRSDKQRDSYKFTYIAAELLEAAKKKQAELYAAEKAARQKYAALTADMRQSVSSKEAEELSRDVTNYGTQREQIDVLVHEFRRRPSREYYLSASDVVYFCLQEHVSLSNYEVKTAPVKIKKVKKAK